MRNIITLLDFKTKTRRRAVFSQWTHSEVYARGKNSEALGLLPPLWTKAVYIKRTDTQVPLLIFQTVFV